MKKRFHAYFLKQCSIINNGSKLPSNLFHDSNEKLPDIAFNSEDIGKVISALDPNKAHGHDMISICMLKMCLKKLLKWANKKEIILVFTMLDLKKK